MALVLSFLCSLLEAVLLSTPSSYASILSKQNVQDGARLERFKENINRPLAAILTLNTFAHTLGAAGVGAQTSRTLWRRVCCPSFWNSNFVDSYFLRNYSKNNW